MKALIALAVWVTVNGFPVESYETCAMAETKAMELQLQFPDLQIRAECDTAHNPKQEATIDYYVPRRETEEANESR